MTASFVAAAYAYVALLGAVVLLPSLAVSFAVGVALWALLIPLFFFSKAPETVLYTSAFVVPVIALSVMRSQAVAASTFLVATFIVIAPAVPQYASFLVPFPAINYLIELNYYKVVSLALLGPALLLGQGWAPVSGGRPVYVILFAYLVIGAVAIGYTVTPTTALRHFFDSIITVFLPFAAVSLVARQRSDLQFLLKALAFASVMLGVITLIASAKQWDFYTLLRPATDFVLPDFRPGFLRIEATANTHSLAWHAALGAMSVVLLRRELGLGFVRWIAIVALLLATMYFTDSRGAALGLVTATMVYSVLCIKSSAVRTLIYLVAGSGTIVGVIWLLSADLSDLDDRGTFDYRRQLFWACLEHIRENFWFGDLEFFRHSRFHHLRQGGGLIDVTNFYLQLILYYGAVGFSLFFLAVGLVMRRLYDATNCRELDAEHTRLVRVLFAALVGWLVLVATTSDVALTLHLGLLLLGMGHAAAYSIPVRRERAAASSEPSKFMAVAAGRG